jgi:transcriptional regulator GlxA family with amidase domain
MGGRGVARSDKVSFGRFADLAFACGFNNLSTFYERYRERFGEAPGETRSRSLE